MLSFILVYIPLSKSFGPFRSSSQESSNPTLNPASNSGSESGSPHLRLHAQAWTEKAAHLHSRYSLERRLFW
jgi:hypothetical protein